MWCPPACTPRTIVTEILFHDFLTHDTRRPTALAQHRVLVVDDQASDTDALCRILQLAGVAVESVQSGIEGLRRARIAAPDCVILDLHIPDLPGLSLLAGLRGADQRLPVIVVTGVYLDEECEMAARALGIAAFLRKPVFAEELLEVIRAALGASAIPVGVGEGALTAELTAPAAGGGFDRACAVETNHVLAEILPLLYRRTQAAYPRESPQLVVNAVHDAVLEQISRAAIIVEDRGTLIRRLIQAAWRNMANAVRSEGRRRSREAAFTRQVPAVVAPGRLEDESGLTRFRLLALAAGDAERNALERWLDGFPEDAIAGALELAYPAESEARREVKRFKDRIRGRARRFWRHLHPAAELPPSE